MSLTQNKLKSGSKKTVSFGIYHTSFDDQPNTIIPPGEACNRNVVYINSEITNEVNHSQIDEQRNNILDRRQTHQIAT